MKSFVLPIAFALSAFVSGMACALFVSAGLERDAANAYVMSHDFIRSFAEGDAAQYLSNIELAQRGNTEAIIRVNCMLLRASIASLAPTPGSVLQPDARKLLQRSNSAITSLNEQNLCSIPTQPAK